MILIDNLINEGWLKTPRIIEAFRKIKRVDFLPKGMENLAELNEALPIGFGQTISQPLVVAFMLEQLQPQPCEKILDIGSGSGWTTALLADLVSQQGGTQNSNPNHHHALSVKRRSGGKTQNGKVIAIEVIPELTKFGQKNVAKYNFIDKGIAKFICADGSKGYPKEAPYDKILVSASAKKLAQNLKEQLKIGGRIVAPIDNSIWLFIKKNETKFEEFEYPGFVFVPLISE